MNIPFLHPEPSLGLLPTVLDNLFLRLGRILKGINHQYSVNQTSRLSNKITANAQIQTAGMSEMLSCYSTVKRSNRLALQTQQRPLLHEPS